MSNSTAAEYVRKGSINDRNGSNVRKETSNIRNVRVPVENKYKFESSSDEENFPEEDYFNKDKNEPQFPNYGRTMVNSRKFNNFENETPLSNNDADNKTVANYDQEKNKIAKPQMKEVTTFKQNNSNFNNDKIILKNNESETKITTENLQGKQDNLRKENNISIQIAPNNTNETNRSTEKTQVQKFDTLVKENNENTQIAPHNNTKRPFVTRNNIAYSINGTMLDSSKNKTILETQKQNQNGFNNTQIEPQLNTDKKESFTNKTREDQYKAKINIKLETNLTDTGKEKKQDNNTLNGLLTGQNLTQIKQETAVTQPPKNKNQQNATLQYPNPIFSREKPIPKSGKPLQRPHIVFIVADDLGWNDVSFHGSDQIMTPNLDILAYTGVVLRQYYTDVQGTASRSALLTGKYPLHLGTQGDSIKSSEDRGIPVGERLLPEYLRNLGYTTHLVGKWDIGKSREQYLPTSRGFDTFYGFLGGSVDYYTYNKIEDFNQTSYFGLDFFNGTKPSEKQEGYLTEVLTDRAVQLIQNYNTSKPMYLHMSHLAPHAGGGLVSLQAPVADIQANQHIAHSARRIYAGMVTNMDKSIGNVIGALAQRRMLQNTIIVFVSDNGAPTSGNEQNYGSNLPLRGMKHTPFEGGARTTGIIWKHSLKSKIYDNLFHVTDWLPTLLSAAGVNGNVDEKLDGLDQWHTIETGDLAKRTDVLVSIEDNWAALREGHFKLIVGNVDEEMCGYKGMEYKPLRFEPPSYRNILAESKTFVVFKDNLNLTMNIDEALVKRRLCDLNNQMPKLNGSDSCIPNKEKGCLFNITSDPLESVDLWDTYPDIVRRLNLRLRTIWTELKPRLIVPDPRANPALHKYVWTPWVQNAEIKMADNVTTPPFPLQVSIGEIQYLVDLNLNMFRTKMFESIKSMGSSLLKTVNGLF